MQNIKFTDILTPAQLTLWSSAFEWLAERAADKILKKHGIEADDIEVSPSTGRYEVDFDAEYVEVTIFPESISDRRAELLEELDDTEDESDEEADVHHEIDLLDNDYRSESLVYRIDRDDPPAWLVFRLLVDRMDWLGEQMGDSFATIEEWIKSDRRE